MRSQKSTPIKSGSNVKCQIFLYILISLVINSRPAICKAVNVESENYKIENSRILLRPANNTAPGLPDISASSSSKKNTSLNSLLKPPSDYLSSTLPLIFSVSKTIIDFSQLKSQQPQTESIDIYVGAGSAPGYKVIAYRDYSDLSFSATACDAGSPCDNVFYGLGYNLSDANIPNTFKKNTYFRPFPSVRDLANDSFLVKAVHSETDSQAQLTVKANIDAGMENRRFEEVINFLAIPTY